MKTPKFIEYVSLDFIQDDTVKLSTTTQGHSKEKLLPVPSTETYYLGLEISQELPMTEGQIEETFIHENTRLCCEVEPRAEAFFNKTVGNCDIILRTGDPGDWRQIEAVDMIVHLSYCLIEKSAYQRVDMKF